MLVTREHAVEVSGKDSRLLEMCSVPGCDHKPACSGHCSAGNSTPVSWQTVAPPKMKVGLFSYFDCWIILSYCSLHGKEFVLTDAANVCLFSLIPPSLGYIKNLPKISIY